MQKAPKIDPNKKYTLKEIADNSLIPGMNIRAIRALVVESAPIDFEAQQRYTERELPAMVSVMRTDEGRLIAVDEKHPFNTLPKYVVYGEDLQNFVDHLPQMLALDKKRKQQKIKMRNENIKKGYQRRDPEQELERKNKLREYQLARQARLRAEKKTAQK